MRAILVKELRENTAWVLLLLLAMSAAMAAAAARVAKDGTSLAGEPMGVVTGVGFPAVGVALGLLQVMQNRRRGRWAFLTHRPISRTTIFLGSVVAGLAMYGFAAGMPLLLTTAWVAVPNHVGGPFSARMILPRVADLAVGIAWYFAGLLVAARRARWVGSRIFPAGMALLVSATAFGLSMNIWVSLAITAAGIALLAPAAWGAFVYDDVPAKQPPAIQPLQTLCVGAGAAMVVGLVLNLTAGALESFVYPTVTQPYSSYQIYVSGQVIVSHTDQKGRETRTDLDGKASEYGSSSARWESLQVAYLSLLPSDVWANLRYLKGLHSPAAIATPLTVTGGQEHWFYVADRQTIEGFDSYTRRFIGSLGPSGFREADQTPERFDEPLDLKQYYSNWGVICSATRTYHMVPGSRQCKEIFRTTAADQIVDAGSYAMAIGNQPTRSTSVVLTKSAVHFLHENGDDVCVPVGCTYPDYNSLQAGETSDGKFVMMYSPNYANAVKPSVVVYADGHGAVSKRLELPRLPQTNTVEPMPMRVLELASVPPFMLAFAEWESMKSDRMAIVLMGIVAVVSAVLVTVLCRRQAVRITATTAWAAFGVFAGIPAVLTAVFMNRLPGRIVCHSCGKRRTIIQDTCDHCGAPFAGPKMEGIEILGS